MGCGDLIESSVLNCNKILQGGVGGDSRLVLISKNHLAAYIANGINAITAITLLAGTSAFSFDGIKQSLKPRFERVASASGQSLYRHGTEFFYFDYSQRAKNNMARMGNGRYIGIYENAKQDVDAFEILGIDAGLEVTEMVRAPQENGGAVRIVMSSPENELEAMPPRTLSAADYAAAKLLVDNLLFLPTIGAGGLSVQAAAAAGGTALTITGTNFFGGGSNQAVTSVDLVNQATGAVVNKSAYTVTATTVVMTGGTPAAAAGVYKVQITTTKGVALSPQNLIVS